MHSEQRARGGCHCGRVRIEIRLPVRGAINCHCATCRALSGAAFSTWLSVPRNRFLYLGGEAMLNDYAASPRVTRRFCSACGTAIQAVDAAYPDVYGVPLGIIRDDIGERPSGHYHVGDKAPWLTLCDGLPQFGGDSGFESLDGGKP